MAEHNRISALSIGMGLQTFSQVLISHEPLRRMKYVYRTLSNAVRGCVTTRNKRNGGSGSGRQEWSWNVRKDRTRSQIGFVRRDKHWSTWSPGDRTVLRGNSEELAGHPIQIGARCWAKGGSASVAGLPTGEPGWSPNKAGIYSAIWRSSVSFQNWKLYVVNTFQENTLGRCQMDRIMTVKSLLNHSSLSGLSSGAWCLENANLELKQWWGYGGINTDHQFYLPKWRPQKVT